MKNYIKSIVLSLFTMVSWSCDESVLDENSPNILTADNLYSDLSGFEAGVTGLYANARMERSNLATPPEMTMSYAFGGTDIITGTYWTTDLNEFGDNITPEHESIRKLWEWLYTVVNASNAIISRAESSAIAWTDAERDQIIGEAKFFRGWAYRHLTYLFGDVPLNLEEADGTNIKTDWSRTAVSDVRNEIVKDFAFAAANLTTDPNSHASNITSWVAKHYLAEMHLAMGNANLAEPIAKDVVDNSPFSLVTSRYGVSFDAGLDGDAFGDMFINGNRNMSEGNTEGMWNHQFEYEVTGGATSYNRRIFLMRYDKLGLSKTAERGGTGKGYLGGSSFLFDLYKQNATDDRFSEFSWRKYYVVSEDDLPLNTRDEFDPTGVVAGDTIWLQHTEADHFKNNTRWSSTRKFEDVLEDNVGTSNGYNDFTYLRLANTYLLLAEAQMATNTGAAAATINVLRQRANAPDVVAGDIDIDFILDERGRELFGEAHRKYHLLRNDLWLSRTNTHNKIVESRATSRDKLLPIPQSVIDANLTKTMAQNPGY